MSVLLLWSVLTNPILPYAQAEFYESLPPTPLDTSTGNVYFPYNITSRHESDDGNDHTYLRL